MAEASTTTVRTVISGPAAGQPDDAVEVMNGFDGVALDPQAQAEIAAALEACAARARAAEAELAAGGEAAVDAAADDPGEPFVRVGAQDNPFLGELVPAVSVEDYVPFVEGEARWTLAGAERPAMPIAWEEEEARRGAEGEDEGRHEVNS